MQPLSVKVKNFADAEAIRAAGSQLEMVRQVGIAKNKRFRALMEEREMREDIADYDAAMTEVQEFFTLEAFQKQSLGAGKIR